MTEPTTVYIARSQAGRPLYVGVTGRRLQRLHAHARAATWWPRAARIQVRHYDTREAALAAERDLIRELDPPFNVVHRLGSHEAYRAAATERARVARQRADADPALVRLSTFGFPPTVLKVVRRDVGVVWRGEREYVVRADMNAFMAKHTHRAGCRGRCGTAPCTWPTPVLA